MRFSCNSLFIISGYLDLIISGKRTTSITIHNGVKFLMLHSLKHCGWGKAQDDGYRLSVPAPYLYIHELRGGLIERKTQAWSCAESMERC
ncbi:hypothetical protein SULI_14660 [Saccharolobus solfataricus]|uniref:Uncharacterized protein n=1 Tax=Saccharolobus solfataricus TaxID=2287 RepID=A0A0E3K706_SACSO|nr:hypothetical protein SULB_2874 [Saccharolobus solfataricus]AKA77623.1 hypothetical protein SULC_2871 [Saccharolobus solfataricus]AKA80314.1 hypothetical protein SULA_2874 [Saccharolobus solfataricus]AZF69391.1 hypothetical protein SULG_14660 [Saccharolobus solfataricus]AZF72011.1 hypothetical protein SULH_14660 [Saccharolobus solfataricus]